MADSLNKPALLFIESAFCLDSDPVWLNPMMCFLDTTLLPTKREQNNATSSWLPAHINVNINIAGSDIHTWSVPRHCSAGCAGLPHLLLLSTTEQSKAWCGVRTAGRRAVGLEAGSLWRLEFNLAGGPWEHLNNVDCACPCTPLYYICMLF